MGREGMTGVTVLLAEHQCKTYCRYMRYYPTCTSRHQSDSHPIQHSLEMIRHIDENRADAPTYYIHSAIHKFDAYGWIRGVQVCYARRHPICYAT
jgi:hypothetical protein